jgi:hypothetical protein
MEDFIRVWPNKGSKELCRSLIDSFEEISSNPDFSSLVSNNASQFSSGRFGRRDMAIFLEEPKFEKGPLVTDMLYLIHDCLMEYLEEFPQLKSLGLTNRANIKIQKTPPQGGYHTWHYESNAGKDSWAREIVWMVYLNDMPEGEAETEFFYQAKKIRPTRGTVVLWPAGLTHVHRGNTVYTQNKYIATGWWYKVEQA